LQSHRRRLRLAAAARQCHFLTQLDAAIFGVAAWHAGCMYSDDACRNRIRECCYPTDSNASHAITRLSLGRYAIAHS
jgi:hypothetical protein